MVLFCRVFLPQDRAAIRGEEEKDREKWDARRGCARRDTREVHSEDRGEDFKNREAGPASETVVAGRTSWERRIEMNSSGLASLV